MLLLHEQCHTTAVAALVEWVGHMLISRITVLNLVNGIVVQLFCGPACPACAHLVSSSLH